MSFSHRDTAADGLFALKDPELLAQEKDINIFVMVSLTTNPMRSSSSENA